MTTRVDMGATSMPDADSATWPIIELNGTRWRVAPVYIAPIARCDVAAVAESWGCEIPPPELVDAIWKAADLRLDPGKLVRIPNDAANGASRAAYLDQAKRIAALVGGRPYRLLAGTHKDFALFPDGRVDLFGWHRLDGTRIENGATSHNARFIDYSQGYRPCVRMDVLDRRPVDFIVMDTSTIRRGSSGDAVRRWQRALNKAGRPLGWLGAWPLAEDGVFGVATEAATRLWQGRRGLAVDGIVGPKTWAAFTTVSEAPTLPQLQAYPFVPAVNFSTRPGRKPRLIVVHTMEAPEKPGTAEAVARWFAGGVGPAPRASCHFCIDNDSIVQSVRVEDVAWHTPGSLGGSYVNDFSIGLEHAGYARQTPEEWADPYSAAMLALSAELVSDLCRAHGIAPTRLTAKDLREGRTNGITGHVDCTRATGSGTHTDPGPAFPWDEYLRLIRVALERKP